jgi:hypothetical protein
MSRVAGGADTPAEAEADAGDGDGLVQGARVLGAIFRAHRGSILLTYALFALENALWMAQPYSLGLAIDGLLRGSHRGLLVLFAQQLAHLLIGVLRRAYDTRMFSRIHTDLVTRLVLEQRRRDVEVTRVVARSALSREFADFFERYVPVALQTSFLMVGGLAILAAYDRSLVLLCVALIVPAGVLNSTYARRTLVLSGRLHDALEREVEVINRGEPGEIRHHYGTVARWRVRLSDSEAWNFGMMELFVMALVAASLVRSCGTVAATPGEILAVLRYVLMFVGGLDGLPVLIQQIIRLRDIGRRCTF